MGGPAARDQIETNLFGALWVTHAALPYLRQAHKGHILQVSSIGGIAAFPGIGIYHASEWALEGLSQARDHDRGLRAGPRGDGEAAVGQPARRPGRFRRRDTQNR
ncbi:NAD(P)-dependent dehydrogenase (short-subunit alcohol dehydrogenase family) [Catenulispora sp. GAS73]